MKVKMEIQDTEGFVPFIAHSTTTKVASQSSSFIYFPCMISALIIAYKWALNSTCTRPDENNSQQFPIPRSKVMMSPIPLCLHIRAHGPMLVIFLPLAIVRRLLTNLLWQIPSYSPITMTKPRQRTVSQRQPKEDEDASLLTTGSSLTSGRLP